MWVKNLLIIPCCELLHVRVYCYDYNSYDEHYRIDNIRDLNASL